MSGIHALLVGARSGAGLSIVDHTLVPRADGSTLELAKPDVVPGDLLLAFGLTISLGGFSSPAGWTEIYDDDGAMISRKLVSGAEGSSFSFSSSFKPTGVMLGIRGASSSPILGARSSGSPNTPTAPSITMPGPGMLIAIFWNHLSGSGFNTPAGFAEVEQSNENRTWAVFKKLVGPGATGDVALSTTQDSWGILVGIKEA